MHRIPAERGSPAEAAAAYAAELSACFETAEGEPPRFDLVYLGLGGDGHTASLFPGREAEWDVETPVAASFVPRLGTHRVTLSLRTLNAARCACFLVTGADKAAALGRVLEPAAGAPVPPARRVRPSSGELLWLVDRAAAGPGGGGESPQT